MMLKHQKWQRCYGVTAMLIPLFLLLLNMVKYIVLSGQSERLAVVAPRGARLRESFSFTWTLCHL